MEAQALVRHSKFAIKENPLISHRSYSASEIVQLALKHDLDYKQNKTKPASKFLAEISSAYGLSS